MFSLVHLHLLVNHSPLYCEMFSFAFLLVGVIRRNRTLVTAGLVIAAIGAVGGLAADWTGDGAADYFDHHNVPGVDKDAIKLHDEAATFVVMSSCITGVFALFVLWRSRGRDRARWMEIVAIVLTLWSVSVAARVSLLGGRVHHQEVRDVIHG